MPRVDPNPVTQTCNNTSIKTHIQCTEGTTPHSFNINIITQNQNLATSTIIKEDLDSLFQGDEGY